MKNGNQHKIPIDLITRFLSGEATIKESGLLNSWLSESQENTKIYEDYLRTWETTAVISGKPSFDLDDEWFHFQSLINPPKKENEIWNFLAGPKFFGSFYRMAAIVAIGLVLGYSIFYFGKQASTQTAISSAGKEKIVLPDGSTVILNKGAEIIYPKTFSKGNRLVSFSGEAYFQVEKDSLCPFIIRSNNLSIRILGTAFNVKAPKDSPEIEVIVNTGIIAVYDGSDRKNEKRILPGQKAVYNKELKKINVSENNNPNFLSWKTGKMEFVGSTLNDVIVVLSSVYHKTFIIKSENLKNCRLTVSFENHDLTSVLKVLEATLDIDFEIKGEVIELNGHGC